MCVGRTEHAEQMCSSLSPSSMPSKHHFRQSTSKAAAPFPRIHAAAMHLRLHGCTHLFLLQPVEYVSSCCAPCFVQSRPTTPVITIDGSTSRLQHHPLNYGLEARTHQDVPASRAGPSALVSIVSRSQRVVVSSSPETFIPIKYVET